MICRRSSIARVRALSEPLYVAYRNFDDYDFEPYFGQFGAFARYEIVQAQAEIAREFVRPAANSFRGPGINVDVVIKPQALGLPQRLGQAKGRIC